MTYKAKAKNGKSITQNVADLLKSFPEARNNDKLLCALYWGIVDEVDFTNFDTFVETFAQRGTPASSIQRRRQYINYNTTKDRFLPTDPGVVEYRRKREQLMSEGGYVEEMIRSELDG